MSLNNSFIIECTCDFCGKQSRIAFEADAGILDLSNFEVNDKLIPDNLKKIQGTVAPNLDVLEKQVDFWVYGVGVCSKCDSEIWAKIIFRSGRFASIEQVEKPENPFLWEIIKINHE